MAAISAVGAPAACGGEDEPAVDTTASTASTVATSTTAPPPPETTTTTLHPDITTVIGCIQSTDPDLEACTLALAGILNAHPELTPVMQAYADRQAGDAVMLPECEPQAQAVIAALGG